MVELGLASNEWGEKYFVISTDKDVIYGDRKAESGYVSLTKYVIKAVLIDFSEEFLNRLKECSLIKENRYFIKNTKDFVEISDLFDNLYQKQNIIQTLIGEKMFIREKTKIYGK